MGHHVSRRVHTERFTLAGQTASSSPVRPTVEPGLRASRGQRSRRASLWSTFGSTRTPAAARSPQGYLNLVDSLFTPCEGG